MKRGEELKIHLKTTPLSPVELTHNPLTTVYGGAILLTVANRLTSILGGFMKKSHYAIYGTIKMKRVYCNKCKSYTLITQENQTCCGQPLEKNMRNKFRVLSTPQGKRRQPLRSQRERILKIQDNKCLYCEKEFGAFYERKGKILQTSLQWDHLVPFSYTQDNDKDNWVAACSICNRIKSNKMFETVEEVFHYVEDKRIKKGYTYFDEMP